MFHTNHKNNRLILFSKIMSKEWKREDCQKKLWNGVHQEEENGVDLNLPGRKIHDVQLKSGPCFNMSNLFTNCTECWGGGGPGGKKRLRGAKGGGGGGDWM
jgi:hypothetical protein